MSRLKNLREVTGRLGDNKWNRARQIVRDYGVGGLFAKLREKMQNGVHPEEDAERAFILTNESCAPRRGSTDSFGAETMVSFEVEPSASNVGAMELLTRCGKAGGSVRLEIFREGERLVDVSAAANPGTDYTRLTFAPVSVCPGSPFVVVVTGSGEARIVTDRHKEKPGFNVSGGGRVFARLYQSTDPVYASWLFRNAPTERTLAAQRQHTFSASPLFSVVVPVFNPPERYFRDMIESVLAQTYPFWELCLADGSTDGEDRAAIAASYGDERIRYQKLEKNEGISGNSNAALAMAKGDYIALLDHDDLLAPHALFENARMLEADPSLEFIYSDEDKVTESGSRFFFPFFKPDFSPNLLDSCNYIAHLTVLKKSLVDEIGPFNSEYEGSQDFDLVLRAAEKAKKVGHIRDILYHWRVAPNSTASGAQAKRYTEDAARRAIAASLARRGEKNATVTPSIQPNRFDISWPLPSRRPPISVLVAAFPGDGPTVQRLLTSLEQTTYPNYEVLLVRAQAMAPEDAAHFEKVQRDARVRVLGYAGAPSFGKMLNFAADASEGKLLTFLSPFAQVISADWLEQLAAQALRKGVGAVGPKIYAPDMTTISSSGMTVRTGRIASCNHAGYPKDHPGSFGRLFVVHDLSALSSCCLMTRREVFERAGGFDPRYEETLCTVDLCLRIRKMGLAVLFTPKAELIEHTRKASRLGTEEERFLSELLWLRTWLGDYPVDPFYNPNLAIDAADYSVDPGVRGQAAARQEREYKSYLERARDLGEPR